MRQPAATFLRATVKIEPDSRTALPCCLYAYVTGTTTYARAPVTSTCHGVPIVTMPSVMPFALALASYALAQSAHAVEPCHVCGGNSSITAAGDAQAASADFTSPVLHPVTNW